MKTIGTIIILAILIFFAILGYACGLAARTPDEKADRMYREYQEYKRRKERKKDDL